MYIIMSRRLQPLSWWILFPVKIFPYCLIETFNFGTRSKICWTVLILFKIVYFFIYIQVKLFVILLIIVKNTIEKQILKSSNKSTTYGFFLWNSPIIIHNLGHIFIWRPIKYSSFLYIRKQSRCFLNNRNTLCAF